MIQNNHIYVLNSDLKSLEQQLKDEGDKKNERVHLKNFILKKKRIVTMSSVK
jgi:hypothetical protein